MDAQATVGDRLDMAMKAAGYRSQKDLERASGVPQATISRILKAAGRCGPETETIRKLAKACSVPFEWLNDGAGETPTPKRPLSPKEVEWLALLEDLGTDDVEEFKSMIKDRQSRNRRLLTELAKKRNGKQ